MTNCQVQFKGIFSSDKSGGLCIFDNKECIFVLLLDYLYFIEVGRSWNADRDTRDDDNAIPRFGHA